jgi:hypothetical protein
MKIKSFFVLMITFSGLLYAQAQTKTSQYEDVPFSGNETWNINNKAYEIEGTSLVGRSLYVIKVLVQDQPSEKYLDDAKAIAKYAVQTDRYIKAGLVSIDGKLVSLDTSIGVAFIKKQSLGVLTTAAGYRFHFLVQDLTEEINIHKLTKEYLESGLNAFLDNFIELYNDGKIDELYDSFPPDYKSQISLDTFRSSMTKNKEKFGAITGRKYLFTLYLGNKGGIDGFNVYLHTDLNSDKLIFKEGFLKLLIIQEGNEFNYFGGEWLLSR